MLKGKNVVLAVTGSIAAYKIANLARMLKKLGCGIDVLMTKNATEFISPLTFESLIGTKCLVDTFDRNFQYSVEHVAIAKKADVVLCAPASANVIGKIASGIADDMLTTTIMACTCKKIISPAMNHNMYHNPIVQDNLKKLESYGYEIIKPATGMLANGDLGDGRMPEEDVLLQYVIREIAFEKDMAGKNVLVTAGATREAIDPVRFITNHSSGKMGYAIAEAASRRGANVKLISAHTDIKPPIFAEKTDVVSAEDMFNFVKENLKWADIVIKAAAVSDYTPTYVADNKLKKADEDLNINLKRTQDILKYIGENKRENQFVCGFAMETENLIENSKKKLENKNCDMICANNLKEEGAGFGTDTNVVTLITKNSIKDLGIMGKDQVAHAILDEIMSLL